MSKEELKKILKNQNHTSKAKKVNLETLNPSDYIIIDVRDPQVFALAPRIAQSLNFKNFQEIQDFCLKHLDQKILLVCNGGLEASKTGTSLVESGLSNIFFLDEYLQIIQDYLPLENT